MTTVRIASNARAVASDLRFVGVTTERKVGVAVRSQAFRLRNLIQAFASGRPGPNVVTDEYRQSWEVKRSEASRPGSTVYEVGTDAEQGYRLELGFHGTDALNRDYSQPPFPHVGPAADIAEMELTSRVGATVPRA